MRSTFQLSQPAAHAGAVHRLLADVRARPLTLAAASVTLASARLLCGDFEAVRDLLQQASAHPALPLLVARHHAWTGDLHFTMSLFERVTASLPLLDDAPPHLRAATWPELERTATDVGDAALAARLVRSARAHPPQPQPQEDTAEGELLRLLLALLGPEPDAFRGRLRLRPDLAGQDAVRFTALRFGDGAIDFSAERVGDAIHCRAEQAAGALPFTLLLEPIVERAPARTEVDGRPATLEPRPHGSATLVPVQLVLDDARRLALHLA